MNHCDRCGFNWTEDEPRTSTQFTNVCPRCQFRGTAPTHTGVARPTPQSSKAIADEQVEIEKQRKPPPPEPEGPADPRMDPPDDDA